MPQEAQALLAPLIDSIVLGIHQAFSIAIANVFMVGVFTTLGALVVTLFMTELPLRQGYGPQHEAEHEALPGAPAGVQAGATATLD